MSELPRNLNSRSMSRKYKLLAGEERFRLILEALARDDELEQGRLRDSIPMREYRISDPAFMDRVEVSERLAFTFALFALPVIAELRAYLRCAVHLLDDGSPVDAVPAELLVRVAEVVTCYAAFGMVCEQEMGLEPVTVLRAHLGGFVDTDEFQKLGTVPADPELVEEWAGVFRDAWRNSVLTRRELGQLREGSN